MENVKAQQTAWRMLRPKTNCMENVKAQQTAWRMLRPNKLHGEC